MNRGFARQSAMLLAAVAIASLGTSCRTARTEISLRIESDLAWGPNAPLRGLRIRAQRDDRLMPFAPEQIFALGTDAASGAVTLPFDFGILPRDGNVSTPILIDVYGCGTADCTGPVVVEQHLRMRFELHRTLVVPVVLASRCAYVSCAAGQRCDANSGNCVDVTAPSVETPPPPSRYVSLSAGTEFTWGVRADGEVACWGASPDRANVLPRESAAAIVSGVPHAVRVSAGASHACAIDEAGHAMCWGAGTSGQLAGGEAIDHAGPAMLVDGAGAPLVVTDLAAGGAHTCWLDAAGEAFCVGENGDGRLGDGTTSFDPVTRAVHVANARGGFRTIAAGFADACALRDDGTVSCWGRRFGTTPREIELPSPAASVTVGFDHACARLRDGSVACWGENAHGQLGAGDFSAHDSAVHVAVESVVDVAAGAMFTCARSSRGRVSCWGRNDVRQIGVEGADSESPVLLAMDASFVEIATGADHVCARDDQGGVRCWGSDASGALGSERTIARVSPAEHTQPHDAFALGASQQCIVSDHGVSCRGFVGSVDGTSDAPRTLTSSNRIDGVTAPIRAVRVGRTHACAIAGDGAVYCWGNNTRGQCGAIPSEIVATPTIVPGLLPISDLALGRTSTCGVTRSGRVYCWGGNDSAQLGLRDLSVTSVTPVAVDGLPPIVEVVGGESTFCARSTTGEVWCWGSNDTGLLTLDASGPSADPVRIALAGPAATMALGQGHGCAALEDGRAFCWGSNLSNQLGTGSASRVERVVQATGLPGAVRDIAATLFGTCALIEGGDVWCWGSNVTFEAGQAPATYYADTAARVPGLSGVVRIEGRGTSMCALLPAASGSPLPSLRARCWGGNEGGQLGIGTETPTNVPTAPEFSDPNVRDVAVGGSMICAASTHGSIECAGISMYATTGDGRFVDRPFAESFDAPDVAGISLGPRALCAWTNAGTVRCWGGNPYGILGTADDASRDEPVDIAGLTNVVEVRTSFTQACARTRTGEVLCWGSNRFSELGVTSGSSHTPVRVGLTAVSIATTDRATCAVTTAGEVRCWGAGDRNLVGSRTDAPTPTVVPTPERATRVRCSSNECMALLASGRVIEWGMTELSQNLAPSIVTPVVPFADGVPGDDHFCTIAATDGSVRCAGTNGSGQLGVVATQVDPYDAVPGLTATRIAAGAQLSCAIVADGTGRVACWGANAVHQLGVGGRASTRVPQFVRGVDHAIDLTASQSSVCALTDDGISRRIACWGANPNGQLGMPRDGAVRPRRTAGPGNPRAVSASLATGCALMDDGAVRCWGALARTNLASRGVSLPWPAVDLAAGPSRGCATNANGTLACWTATTGAMEIGGAATSDVELITVGGSHACFRSGGPSGRPFCFGGNGRGQLGVGTFETGTFPESPLVTDGIESISAGTAQTCAVAASRVYCWGDNESGQLGSSDHSRPVPVPVRVEGIDDARMVSTSTAYGCERDVFGIRTCGPLHRDHTCVLRSGDVITCFGNNRSGQLGSSDREATRNDLTVAGATAVVANGTSTCVTRETASPVCWGGDRYGELAAATSPLVSNAADAVVVREVSP